MEVVYNYPSPLGILQIKANENHVYSLLFLEEANDHAPTETNMVIDQCVSELDAYFAGTLTVFKTPITQAGTAFQQSVWAALLNISFGKTCSYMDLSKRLGNPKAIRAVGTTNGKNCIAIIVPCHRVIGSNQSLTGYAGGLWRKQWLLDHENKHANGVRELF